MTKGILIETLQKHGIATADNGHFVNVKEEYTLNGIPGHDWKAFYPECWTMKDLLRWLGY